MVFALDATAEKVTEGIYLLAPRGISVRNDTETNAPLAETPLPIARSTARVANSRDEQEELFWQGR
ncbi:MAG: cell division protein SepF [Gammaproteobacteria bacterium]|nr:cell division protein SepF [Gammaproteobacteria bacterium]